MDRTAADMEDSSTLDQRVEDMVDLIADDGIETDILYLAERSLAALEVVKRRDDPRLGRPGVRAQLDRLLDCFLLYGSTTTTIIQSSPVPLRPPPLPEDSLLE